MIIIRKILKTVIMTAGSILFCIVFGLLIILYFAVSVMWNFADYLFRKLGGS